MLRIEIPGRNLIEIDHLVCDVNGTLALDGVLLPGITAIFNELKPLLQIHMLTADTHGKQKDHARVLGIDSHILTPGNEAEQKAAFIRQLGSKHVAAIGQGANDALMLKEATLGICVLSSEGAATDTLMNADLITPDIFSGLALFTHPQRLVATLRK